MVEVYKAINSNKKYLVSADPTGLWKEALKRWKIADSRLVVTSGWILNGDLYLDDPHNRKAVHKWVAYTIPERKKP